MDGLIFKIGSELILFGEKTWEVRSKSTKKRGEIYILNSRDKNGKHYCLGIASLDDCIPMTKSLFENNYDKHKINVSWEDLSDNYRNGYIWVFSNPQIFVKNGQVISLEYQPKAGCRTWIKEVHLVL